MNRRTNTFASPRITLGWGWFVLRVPTLIGVLAVPILGTSFALVSSVTADLRTAAINRAELAAAANVVALVPLIESVHRDLADHRTADEARDREAVERTFDAALAAYDGPAGHPETRAALRFARDVWSHRSRWTPAQASTAP